jgi:transcriptional regulator with XRE-family HTH domain
LPATYRIDYHAGMKDRPDELQPTSVWFRQNLRAACRKRGDLSALARNGNFTRMYIWNVLHGHCIPSIDNAAKLAVAAGLTLPDLLLEPKTFARQHNIA